MAANHKFTPAEVEEYKSAFALFDKDGDGKITTHELGTVMRQLHINPTEEELKDMVNEVDHDGNGEIDFEEFLHLMAIKVQPTDTVQEIKQAFAVFDTDGDGSITREELGNVMKSLGENLTDQELEDMLEHADTNGDGLISLEEFIALLSS